MSGCCHEDSCSATATKPPSGNWRRALWIAFAVNAVMFAAEMIAGFGAKSSALQADALDFFGDAANYAVSLGVAGLALSVRARAAFLKGATLAVLSLWVIGSAGWSVWSGAPAPHAEVMGIVGFVALAANAGVALLLFQFRNGEANMRSVWICSRNDAIGNVAVMLAAAGVFGTGSIWPDIIVAGAMAALGMSGGISIMRQAAREIRQTRHAAAVAAE